MRAIIGDTNANTQAAPNDANTQAAPAQRSQAVGGNTNESSACTIL